ncbi:MAG: D-tyrosyl-tRNA(Tyr) deacylase [Armatimonadetes bacterium]|nr:D-tyrosyl-tRNA(Tyr) deacylase [Armatimonadota bacterium]
MRAVIQRVSRANLVIDGEERCRIGVGLVVLAGFGPGDATADLQWMAEKIATLRVFGDDEGRMNLAVGDVGGELLVVPNFTLYGDCRKGRRPGYSAAAAPERATALFDQFCDHLQGLVPVQRGVFGAHMHVSLTNDGPVTLLLDSAKTF